VATLRYNAQALVATSTYCLCAHCHRSRDIKVEPSGHDIMRSPRPHADRTLRATGITALLSNGVAVVISSNWGGFAGWVGRG
jgi:hypothetical protein